MDGRPPVEGKRVVHEATFEDGTRQWEYEDGNLYRRSPDGETVHLDPSGRTTWHLLDGTVRFQDPDGTTGVTFRDGTTRTQSPDGVIRTLGPFADRQRVFLPSGEEVDETELVRRRVAASRDEERAELTELEGAKRGCTPPVIATIVAVVVALGGAGLVVALRGDDDPRAGGSGSGSGSGVEETTTTTEEEDDDDDDTSTTVADDEQVDVSGTYEVNVDLVDSDVIGGTQCAEGGEFELVLRMSGSGDERVVEFDAEGNVTEAELAEDLSFEAVTEIDEDGASGSFVFAGQFEVEGTRIAFEAREDQDILFEDGSSTSCTNEFSGVRISGP